MNALCSVDGCGGAIESRGWCARHYTRWFRTGSPEGSLRRSAQVRFWSKVVAGSGGCWEWAPAVGTGRYGKFDTWSAHRWAYEHMVGEIPPGLTLDHLCRNKVCVNPDHLDPVPGRVNTLRARALITHCKQGHEFTEENTYVWTNGWRKCRVCMRVSSQRNRDACKIGEPK